MNETKPVGVCFDCEETITTIGSQLRIGWNKVEIFCLKCAAKRLLDRNLGEEKEIAGGKKESKRKSNGIARGAPARSGGKWRSAKVQRGKPRGKKRGKQADSEGKAVCKRIPSDRKVSARAGGKQTRTN